MQVWNPSKGLAVSSSVCVVLSQSLGERVGVRRQLYLRGTRSRFSARMTVLPGGGQGLLENLLWEGIDYCNNCGGAIGINWVRDKSTKVLQ